MDNTSAPVVESKEEKVGEKRSPPIATEGESTEPQEKKPKLDSNDAPETETNVSEPTSNESDTTNEINLEGIEFEIPPPNEVNQSENGETPESVQPGIPYPPGYDPSQSGSFITTPLAPVNVTPTRRTRRRKSELLTDAFQDPDSKWSILATQKLLSLYETFGKRRVLDEKLHNEIVVCLNHRANPAVTLVSPDGMSFFTYLTVAAEFGDLELVKRFLTEFREEFQEYDFKASLHAALANKEQEIAEYLLQNTDVVPDREAVVEMFDVAMSDDLDRKVAPLKAFIERCIDTEKYPAKDFFVPEFLNRAIYANNVAALEVLFEKKREQFLPLLEEATPDSNIIRAGRGKAHDIGEGVPPLVYAAVMERPDCLEVFLKAGANPNFIWNDMGGTLLHIVGQKGNTEMTELLIEYNADPRIVNAQGYDALSRTKGRKARKCITDALARFNQSSIVLPPNQFVNHMNSNMVLSGEPFHPIMTSGATTQGSMPMSHTLQQNPPPFAKDSVIDIPPTQFVPHLSTMSGPPTQPANSMVYGVISPSTIPPPTTIPENTIAEPSAPNPNELTQPPTNPNVEAPSGPPAAPSEV